MYIRKIKLLNFFGSRSQYKYYRFDIKHDLCKKRKNKRHYMTGFC
jgi:hypothetical protein